MSKEGTKLSRLDRLFLSNQLRILEALYPEEANDLARRREALECGYEMLYDWDMDRWRLVSRRKPLEFLSEGALESPEEKAILAKLNSNPQPFNFSSATIQEWAAYFGDRTGVNFVVAKSASEKDTDATTLIDFSLPPRTAAQALNVIGVKAGIGDRHSRIREPP